MPSSLRVAMVAFITCGLVAAVVPSSRGADAATNAFVSDPVSAPGHHFCPVRPYVTLLDDSKTRYAVSLDAIHAGDYSGTITMYAGNSRYDIPFHGLTATGFDRRGGHATPLVIQFPQSTNLDGAWVSALDGAPACEVAYAPWASNYPNYGRSDAAYLAELRLLKPVDAPSPTIEARACDVPDRVARTLKAAPVRVADVAGGPDATVGVLVLIDDQNAVIGEKISESASFPADDQAALDTVARSTFLGATFRCRPIVAYYLFRVSR